MSENAVNVIDALKATAEMCGIFIAHLQEQGFSRREALTLTQTFLQETIKPKSKEEK